VVTSGSRFSALAASRLQATEPAAEGLLLGAVTTSHTMQKHICMMSFSLIKLRHSFAFGQSAIDRCCRARCRLFSHLTVAAKSSLVCRKMIAGNVGGKFRLTASRPKLNVLSVRNNMYDVFFTRIDAAYFCFRSACHQSVLQSTMPPWDA